MGLPNFSGFIGRQLRQLLAAFDLTTGHDHDGVNSKAVTTGAPAAGALAASAAGRAIMADGYFDKATVAAKFAADSIDNAELIQLIRDGAFNADAATRALFDAGIWQLAHLDAGARTHILSYQVEDLAAGADIAARAIFEVPAGFAATVVSASIIMLGASAGVDDANTSVIALSDGTNDIVTATYKTSALPPAANASASLGEPAADHKILAAGEKLHLVVTNGATANLPAFMVQVVYSIAAA